jgi:flagellar biosynthetic protein FlhB
MAKGDNGDKTEAPTGKRKREARRNGQIAKSPEVALWAEVLVATFLIPGVARRMMDVAAEVLGGMRGLDSRSGPGDMLEWLRYGVTQSVLIVMPLTLAVMGVAVLSNVAQTGLYFSGSLLKPKFGRMNPLKGFKRLVSPESFWNIGKMVVKVGVLALVAWPMTVTLVESLASAQRPEIGTALAMAGATSLDITRRIALAGLLLAIVDYGLAQRRTRKELKMSKQDIRDEGKQTEGNPQAKAGIKRRQVEISRNRMLNAVSDASVVIVNPVHVAVALAYGPGYRAPTVVAKGKGAIALRIKEKALESGVPIVRDIPLARTLHDACDVDEEIPASLYEAVARILAFLFSMKNRIPFGGELVVP